MNHIDILKSAKRCLRIESAALETAAETLDDDFVAAVEIISQSKGKLVVTGLGKSGHIASKIVATMSSTGTTAIFLHPSEALHGDLGVIDEGDVLLAIAQGGATEEVLQVASYARRLDLPVIAITGKTDSQLAKLATKVISSAIDKEACPLNLAPTASSTVAMGLGDALAVALMEYKGFQSSDFAQFHPGGSLGRRLKKIDEFMISDAEFYRLNGSATLAEVAAELSKSNHGIIGVNTDQGELAGVITDGDVRRVLFGAQSLETITAKDFMSTNPITIGESTLAIEAINLMEKREVTAILVFQDSAPDKIKGLIKLHDLLKAKIY